MEWVKTAPKTTIKYICRVWKGALTENDITINDVLKEVRPDCFKTKKVGERYYETVQEQREHDISLS